MTPTALLLVLATTSLTAELTTAPNGDLDGDGQVGITDIQCAVNVFATLAAAPITGLAPCPEAGCGPNETCREGFTPGETTCLPSCLAPQVALHAGAAACDDKSADTAECKGLVPKQMADMNCDGDISNVDLQFLVALLLGSEGGAGTHDNDNDGRLNGCDDEEGPISAPCPPDNEGVFQPEGDMTLSGAHTYTSLLIPEGVTVTGAGGSPLELTVCGDAVVEGTITVSGGKGQFSFGANATNGNPGGAPGGSGGAACCGGHSGGGGGHSPSGSGSGGSGPGSGKGGSATFKSTSFGNFWNGGNAGGGGHATPGTAGWFKSTSTGSPGSGGGAYGSSLLEPPTGGSGGGGGSAGLGGASTGYGGAGGGGGGGVLSLDVAGTLTIGAAGELLADGAPGGSCQDLGAVGGGGAGAGGAVVLSATLVTNLGLVSAAGGVNCYSNGGGPGDGAGGAGRIRVNTQDGKAPAGSFVPTIGFVGAK